MIVRTPSPAECERIVYGDEPAPNVDWCDRSKPARGCLNAVVVGVAFWAWLVRRVRS